MPFSQLGLFSSIARGAQAAGYVAPTPIQQQAIPAILSGRDLVASAQTGTGKTAAFALPVLNRLGPHRAGGPRVLVLEPTRELAAQVRDSFLQLGKFTDLKTALLHGGVPHGPQRKALQAGADIVVSTTGRLLEFIDDKALRLDRVEVLVLDEVDRMLDMGFIKDVKRIVSLCPKARQTLLFSATIPPKLEEIARFALTEPARIQIAAARSVAEAVNHAVHPVHTAQKPDLLLALLEHTDFKSVIIFTRTKRGAENVAHRLRVADHSVTVLHSDRSQAQRTESLEGFRGGKFDVLVATDIAARGIDVAGVSHVINYDVPQNPEDYVHRVGRTGRAEAVGDAFMLATPDQVADVAAIEKYIGRKIALLTLEGFAYLDGAPPALDTALPVPPKPRTQGRQRLGAGGRQKGDTGEYQSKSPSRPAFGGGNPRYHSKGKPGSHWRKGAR